MAGDDAGRETAKERSLREDRLGQMKMRLLALPSGIILKPEDLEANLERLEAIQNNPSILEKLALSIVEAGYR